MICEVEMQRKALVGQQLTKVALVGVVGGQALHGAQALLKSLMSLLLQSLLQTHQHKHYKDGLTTMRLLLRALCRDSDKHINCKQNLSITHTQGCRDDCMSYNDDSTVKIELAAAEFCCVKREK